nr:glutathione s-transferase-like protein usts [Quercus suber]
MPPRNEVVLFDLPSRAPQTCWSLNPWKARLVLNYKAIPYTTEWLEYPQIAPTLQSYNVPPNLPSTNSNASYSLPCIRLPNGEYIMDSLVIAHALEALHPKSPLHLDSSYVTRVQASVNKILDALSLIWTPRLEMLLTSESTEYVSRKQAQRIGMTLTEMVQRCGDGTAAWRTAEPALEELRTLLHECPDGPFLMGVTVSFADFVLAGLCRYLERLSVEGDLFKKLMESVDLLSKHYEACRPWLIRDNY